MYDVTRKNRGDQTGTPPNDAIAARAADKAEAKATAARERAAAKPEEKAAAAAAKSDTARAKSAGHVDRARNTVSRAVAKVDGVLAAEAAKQERLAERAEEQAANLDRLAGYLGHLDVWTRDGPAGRKPRFTREEIAAAAIRIADEEGLDALSMRYLAAQLGAGTMTLYHYVRTKDELMTLVTDAIVGEIVLPTSESLPAEWRAACMEIARRSRTVMRRHPWLLDLTDDPPLGPNSLRHFDQTLAAVASLDLALADRLDIVTAVDEYVFGYCLNERRDLAQDGGIDKAMKAYVSSLLTTGDYPELQALVDSLGLEQAWMAITDHQRDDGRFERNLDRLLDGFESDLLGRSERG